MQIIWNYKSNISSELRAKYKINDKTDVTTLFLTSSYLKNRLECIFSFLC